jgi:excisionase family DNA binding protein
MREGDAEMDKMLLTKEVAETLRVSEEYVRELIRRKKLRAYKEGRRGGYRIMPLEVEKYVQEKQKESEIGKVKNFS